MQLQLILSGHTYGYHLECLLRMFYPLQKVQTLCCTREALFHAHALQDQEDIAIYTVLTSCKKGWCCHVCLYTANKIRRKRQVLQTDTKEAVTQAFALLLYDLLTEYTGRTLPWGIYTGIRPVKTVLSLQQTGQTDEQIRSFLSREYRISPEKLELALCTANNQRSVLDIDCGDSYSLFVFVPFCPNRCKYCSFVSHAIAGAGELVEPYLQCLLRELEAAADAAARMALRLDAIYIGGGTPTVLSAAQLNQLLCKIDQAFSPSLECEYTVEAGRPDTITAEKLAVLRRYGVGRISVNPQTFNDEVLRKIGRGHTARDVLQSYALVRSFGFDSVNMDLIAGLPDESGESFSSSLETAISLAPENITIHTLTRKRASELGQNTLEEAAETHRVKKMLQMAEKALYPQQYIPYYLYRQKNTIGSLENVGYTKPGKLCAYNVRIMQENQTILACGAGGSTKLVQNGPRGQLIRRIYNYKYPYEYIDRFDEILARKTRLPEAFSGEKRF